MEILSGVLDGLTLGTPIAMMVRNEDARSRDYDELQTKYRPSHADFAYDQKFGIRAWFGGGRASARDHATTLSWSPEATFVVDSMEEETE